MTTHEDPEHWPYPDITPMHAHRPSGQWRRRHKGRDYYFGVIANPKAALARWRAEWPLIVSGKQVVIEHPDAAVGLQDACSGFLSWKVSELERDRIVADTLDSWRQRCQGLCDVIGNETPLRLINPQHFDALLDSMRGMAPSTQADRVVKYTTILQWVSKKYHVPVDIPDEFRGPPMKVRRLAGKRVKMWKPADVHAVLNIAPPILRACILLGINGGYKPNDLAHTRTDELDMRDKVIRQKRRKTGSVRCVPLWPETMAAIKPIMDSSRDLLLVWPNGLPLVRHGCRDLSRALKPLRDAAGVTHEYQWLRHTFATVAEEVGDEKAKDLIMGHVRDSVPDNYVLTFPIKRLRKVSDHVRRWLYG